MIVHVMNIIGLDVDSFWPSSLASDNDAVDYGERYPF